MEGLQPPEVPDWNNLDILHRNTLPTRAYFHNYTNEADASSYDITKSKTRSLSGIWKFQLSDSPFEAPDGFEKPSFDTSSWSDIAVPGMWQLQGFGRGPQYTNIKYPIPVDPPNVPFTDNETGSYVRSFKIPEDLREDQIRLRFEGVDSSFHVWVNGKEVGYSQGSRNPSEFDITNFLDMVHENTLAVRVYQRCDGTYIEDQDQWWLSGIFRDVYLVGFPLKSRIENVHVQTWINSPYVDAKLHVTVHFTGNGDLRIKLLDNQLNRISSLSSEGTETVVKFSICVKNPLKWTAETPHLYYLIVSLNSEQYIPCRIGFRQVEIRDGLLKVNGKRIVFHGVNRHEHHPQFGRAVPLEFLKRDLLLMKRHNINAIRTSHQPNDPRLYDLADEMGFWVIDEADLECHGFEIVAQAALSANDRALPFHERKLLTAKSAAEWTTDNPRWEDAYVGRAQHLVKRDQLHPSVIIWSLGNEAFFGRNFKAMYDWIKSYDDSRPIHYEPDWNAEVMDMYSRMYSSIDDIVAFGKDESKTKPLILCEFIHAMGNGPGNIKEYIDAFYTYPKLQGGFAWEWANHGLLNKDKNTGEEYYGYGGDFGETVHDSTFVMDGLLNSDHTPNPGLLEYKKAIQPVEVLKFRRTESGFLVKFVNRYNFLALDHLACHFYPGPADAVLKLPNDIGPGQDFDLEFPLFPQRDKQVILSISFRLKTGTPWLEQGFEVAKVDVESRSIELHLPPPSNQLLEVDSRTVRNFLSIYSEITGWNFNTVHGNIPFWHEDGMKLISRAPEISFFRAQTDNDKPQDGREWDEKLLQLATPSTQKVEWSQPNESQCVVTVNQRIAPPVLSWAIDCVLTYTFDSNSSLRIHVSGTPTGDNLPRTLARIGLVMSLPKEYQRVEWFGRGPGESYRDSKFSQQPGKYSVDNVDALWTDYEVPQESSNRTDTRWLKLSNGERALLVQFIGKEKQGKLFDFQVSHYRMEDVAEARHPYELRKKKREEVVLRLDMQHHGLGSGSCGPKTLDKYALFTDPFEFEVLLQCEPVKGSRKSRESFEREYIVLEEGNMSPS